MIDRIFARHFTMLDRSRHANARDKVSIIINATFKLSTSMGFSKMTMRDLQKESDISLGGLYIYFANKESLAAILVDALHEFKAERFPVYIDATLPREVQLERLIRGYIYLGHALRKWFCFMFMEFKTLPDSTKKTTVEIELDFQQHLDLLFGTRFYPGTNLVALMQDWFLKYWKYSDMNVDEFADLIVRMALMMMRDIDAGNAPCYQATRKKSPGRKGRI
jgi:TetR/AcrR family transcriptional regulator, cholesterol catabolism regulator